MRKNKRRDQLARYEQAVYAMPWIAAEVFLRHRLDNLSYHEIAARFGIGVDEVEKHVAEALYAIAPIAKAGFVRLALPPHGSTSFPFARRFDHPKPAVAKASAGT